MMLNQSLFGIAPKTFKAINIDFPSRKSLGMINFQMPVSTEHERIIASKFIGIHNAPSSNSLNCKVQNRICGYIFQNVHLHDTISFQYSKHRDLISRTASSGTFSFSSKICFINFDFSFKEVIGSFISSDNGHSYQMDSFQHRGVTEFNLLSNSPSRNLKLKQLHYPEPLLMRDPQLTNPSSGEIGKGIFTPTAPIALPPQSIDSIAPTSYAETAVSFPTQFYKEQPCSIFASDKCFKAFYSHLHHYKWCQMFYNYLKIYSPLL